MWAGTEAQADNSLDVVGCYSPHSIDSGVTLCLLQNMNFEAEWWGQDMKSGDLIGAKIVGKWSFSKGCIFLEYTEKSKKQTCSFRYDKTSGERVLILEKQSSFPFTDFFGDAYHLVKNKPTEPPSESHADKPSSNDKAPKN
jgi:hypothetical protein